MVRVKLIVYTGASSTFQREDGIAFATQFEGASANPMSRTLILIQTTDVDRAMDNLVKSGKFYAGGPRPMGAMRPGSDYGK